MDMGLDMRLNFGLELDFNFGFKLDFGCDLGVVIGLELNMDRNWDCEEYTSMSNGTCIRIVIRGSKSQDWTGEKTNQRID
jgi:hypothetical protein